MEVQSLFPSALVACIRDGRPPEPHELAGLSDRLRAEAACFWAADRCDLADRFASVALSGGRKDLEAIICNAPNDLEQTR